jgi:hypothetical protein
MSIPDPTNVFVFTTTAGPRKMTFGPLLSFKQMTNPKQKGIARPLLFVTVTRPTTADADTAAVETLDHHFCLYRSKNSGQMRLFVTCDLSEYWKGFSFFNSSSICPEAQNVAINVYHQLYIETPPVEINNLDDSIGDINGLLRCIIIDNIDRTKHISIPGGWLYQPLVIPELLISEINVEVRKEIREILVVLQAKRLAKAAAKAAAEANVEFPLLKRHCPNEITDEEVTKYLPKIVFSIHQYALLTTTAAIQHRLFCTDDDTLYSTEYRPPPNFDALVDYIIGSLTQKIDPQYNPCFFFHIQASSVEVKKYDEIPILRCILCLDTPFAHRRSSTFREILFRWMHKRAECDVTTLFQPPFKEDWPPKRTFVGLFYREIEKLIMDMDIKFAQNFWKDWRTVEDRHHNLNLKLEPGDFFDELFKSITAGNPKIEAFKDKSTIIETFKVKCLEIAGTYPNEEQPYCELAKFTTLFKTLCPSIKPIKSFNVEFDEAELKLPNVNWNILSKSDDDDDVLAHIARYHIIIRPDGICELPTSQVLHAIFDIVVLPVKLPELKRKRSDDVGNSYVTAYPSYVFLQAHEETHPLLTNCGTFAIVPSCIHPISPFAQCERLGSYKAILNTYFLNNPIMNAIKQAILNFHEKTGPRNIVINMVPFPTVDDVSSGGGVYKNKLSKKQSQKRKKTRKMRKIKKSNKSKKCKLR